MLSSVIQLSNVFMNIWVSQGHLILWIKEFEIENVQIKYLGFL